MSTNDLSIEVATAHAPGGVAVVELRGAAAAAALARVAPRGRFAVGRATLANLVDGDELIDEAVVVARAGGGFDLCVHGSPAVVARLVRALRVHDAPRAAPLSWADVARRRLATVVSEAGARILVDQMQGTLDEALAQLHGCARPAAAAAELARLGRVAMPFLTPPRVVLVGAVNAGKSTLFNLLVGRERVLADARPGTTRDVVRELVRDGDLVLELIDTAGARELGSDGGEEAVEAQGQRLAIEVANSADLLLWCRAATSESDVERLDGRVAALGGPTTRLATLWTRTDLAPAPPGAPAVQALHAPAEARRTVLCTVRGALEIAAEPWQAGRAVPIDPLLVDALAEAAREGDAAVRTAAVQGRFAPTPRATEPDRGLPPSS